MQNEPKYVFYCHLAWSACTLSRVQVFVTPRTVARQTPLSMGFPRQEYLARGTMSPVDLPDPGIEAASFVSPTLAGGFFTN